jgi:hypothetical protein
MLYRDGNCFLSTRNMVKRVRLKLCENVVLHVDSSKVYSKITMVHCNPFRLNYRAKFGICNVVGLYVNGILVEDKMRTF